MIPKPETFDKSFIKTNEEIIKEWEKKAHQQLGDLYEDFDRFMNEARASTLASYAPLMLKLKEYFRIRATPESELYKNKNAELDEALAAVKIEFEKLKDD